MRPLPNSLDIPEIEKAWFSGFFDADGSIGIRKDSRDYHCLHLQLNLRVAHSRIIERFKSTFGGSVVSRDNSTTLQLQVWTNQAATMLSTLLPYLYIKRTEALVALSFWQRYSCESDRYTFGEGCKGVLSILREAVRDVEAFDTSKYTTLAYIGGYFDGDGCVGVYDSSGRGDFKVTVEISSDLSCWSYLELFKPLFGGYVHRQSSVKGIGWRLEGTQAPISFLETIEKYTWLKREQIRYSLEYLQLPPSSRLDLGLYYHDLLVNLKRANF